MEEKHTYANSFTDDYVSYFFHQSDYKHLQVKRKGKRLWRQTSLLWREIAFGLLCRFYCQTDQHAVRAGGGQGGSLDFFIVTVAFDISLLYIF